MTNTTPQPNIGTRQQLDIELDRIIAGDVKADVHHNIGRDNITTITYEDGSTREFHNLVINP